MPKPSRAEWLPTLFIALVAATLSALFLAYPHRSQPSAPAQLGLGELSPTPRMLPRVPTQQENESLPPALLEEIFPFEVGWGRRLAAEDNWNRERFFELDRIYFEHNRSVRFASTLAKMHTGANLIRRLALSLPKPIQIELREKANQIDQRLPYLAFLLLRLQNLNEAFEMARLGLHHSPNNPDAHLIYALSLAEISQGDIEAARDVQAALSATLRLDPVYEGFGFQAKDIEDEIKTLKAGLSSLERSPANGEQETPQRESWWSTRTSLPFEVPTSLPAPGAQHAGPETP